MIRKLTLAATALSALALTACGGGGEKVNLLEVNEDGANLDALADTQWIYEQILPGGEVKANVGTRVRLYNEDGGLRANYNVSSLGDMYEFTCERRSRDVLCTQILDEDFVYNTWASFVIQEKACDTEADAECGVAMIQELSPATPVEVIRAGIEKAEKEMGEMQSNAALARDWAQFQQRHNYLGNKLGFFFYLEVDSRGNLKLIDMYKTFYNGSWVEDSNPVGRSNFLKNDEELFWGDCEDYAVYSRKEAEFPTLSSAPSQCFWGDNCVFGVGEQVNYLYLGNEASEVEAGEGCTYSYDVAVDGRSVSTNNTPELVEQGGKSYVSWSHAQSFDEAGTHSAAIVMRSTCPDEEPVEFTSCTRVEVR